MELGKLEKLQVIQSKIPFFGGTKIKWTVFEFKLFGSQLTACEDGLVKHTISLEEAKIDALFPSEADNRPFAFAITTKQERWILNALSDNDKASLLEKLKPMLGDARNDAEKESSVITELVVADKSEEASIFPNEEEAWTIGENCSQSFISTSTAQTAITVAGTAVINLLDVAREAPLIGPAAGILCKFYQAYDNMQGNKDALGKLKDRVDDSRNWLNDTVSMFKGQTKVDQKIVRSLKKLSKAVCGAAVLVERLCRRLEKQSLLAAGLGMLLADKDNADMNDIMSSLDEALHDLRQGMSAIAAMQELISALKKIIQLLKPVLFDSTIDKHANKSVEGSRAWLHAEMMTWIETKSVSNDTKQKLFWLKADAGMGKSVFAGAAARKLESQNILLGVMFFEYNDVTCSDPIVMIKSLACQMAQYIPALQEHVLKAAEKVQNQNEELEYLCKQLIVTPLQEYEQANNAKELPPKVLILDALDEIADDKVRALLSFLSNKLLRQLPSWVKVLVTSRPEQHIANALMQFQPHEIQETDPRHLSDLQEYILQMLPPNVSRDADNEENVQALLKVLMKKCENKFVYISLVVDELQDMLKYFTVYDDEFAQRLETELPNGLSAVYAEIASKAEGNSKGMETKLHQLLQILVVSYMPLSSDEAKWLLELDHREISILAANVKKLFPLRQMQKTNGELVKCFYSYHKSVVDWLVNREEARKHYIDPALAHVLVSSQLFTAMCIESSYGKSLNIKTVENEQLQSVIRAFDKASVSTEQTSYKQYICSYFVDHLDAAGLCVVSYKLLMCWEWLEMVTLVIGVATMIGCLSGRYHNDKWRSAVERRSMKILMKFFGAILPAEKMFGHDKHRWRQQLRWQFVARFQKSDICEACTEFMEMIRCCRSKLSQYGWSNNLLSDWSDSVADSALEQIFREHNIQVYCVCKLSNHFIASGGDDKTIKIWHIDTGVCMKVLIGHEGYVNFLVALSNDQFASASGSNDGTVRIWDVERGECTTVLDVRCYEICSLCRVSNDIIAFGGRNRFGIWSISEAKWVQEAYHTQVEAGHRIPSVDFSLCPVDENHLLMKIISDTANAVPVQLYKIKTGLIEKVFDDAVGYVCMVGLNKFVSWSKKEQCVGIWDLSTGVCLSLLKDMRVFTKWWYHLGNDLIAGCSEDFTIHVCNIETMECVNVLAGHDGWVGSICRISDNMIASGSCDGTVRIWNINYRAINNEKEHYKTKSMIVGVCVITANMIATTGSADGTIALWSAVTGDLITKYQHGNSKVSALCKLDDDVFASGFTSGNICICSTATGECRKELKGHGDSILALYKLEDSFLISVSRDETIRKWDPESGVGEVLFSELYYDSGTCLISMTSIAFVLRAPYDNQEVAVVIGDLVNAQITTLHNFPNSRDQTYIKRLCKLSNKHLLCHCLQGTCSTVYVLNIEALRCDWQFAGSEGAVFHPISHSQFLACSEEALSIWDIETKQCVHSLNSLNLKLCKSVFKCSTQSLMFFPDVKFSDFYVDGGRISAATFCGENKVVIRTRIAPYLYIVDCDEKAFE